MQQPRVIISFYFIHLTYWTPSTVPLFLPDGSSNWTPHQFPGANFVSPTYCKIPARDPIPDDTITRSPTPMLHSARKHTKSQSIGKSFALFPVILRLTWWWSSNIARNAARWTDRSRTWWRCNRANAHVCRWIAAIVERLQCESC